MNRPLYQGRLEEVKSNGMQWKSSGTETIKKVTKISGRGGLGEEVDRLRSSNFRDLTRKNLQLVFWIGGRLLREVR